MLPLPATQQGDVLLDIDIDESDFTWRVFLDRFCRDELECTLEEMTEELIKAKCLERVTIIDPEDFFSQSDEHGFIVCTDQVVSRVRTVWCIHSESYLYEFITTNALQDEKYEELDFLDEFVLYDDEVINVCLSSIMKRKRSLLDHEGFSNEEFDSSIT